MQFARIERLDPVGVEARRGGRLPIGFASIAGQCNQRRVGQLGDFSDFARQLLAVRSWQTEVEDRDVRLQFTARLQTGHAVAGGGDFETFVPQRFFQHHACVGVIFHQQQARACDFRFRFVLDSRRLQVEHRQVDGELACLRPNRALESQLGQ